MTGRNDITKTPLKRTLNLPTAIFLVAGLIIGAGIFKKISSMSLELHSAISILWAWLVAGIITMLGAFTYSGLSSMTTEAGGIYEYIRIIYGDFVAYLLGWIFFTIIGSGSIAALAIVFAQTLAPVIHLYSPIQDIKDFNLLNLIYPFRDVNIKILAVCTVIILTWLNYRGIKKASTLNTVITIAKILGILILIGMGITYQPPKRAIYVFQGHAHKSLFLSVRSFLTATLSAFWAYDGWANITYISGEIKNPRRTITIAIIGGVGISIIIYLALNYIYMKVLPLSALASIDESKIAAVVVAETMMGRAGALAITILIAICTLGALNANIIVYPRMYFRMAQQNSYFPKAAFVHPRFNTPYISLIYSSIWSCILIFATTFDKVTNLVTVAGFLFFILAAIGLIKMKRNKIITDRVIGYPLLTIVAIVFSILLVINAIETQLATSLLELSLILSGIPFYFYFKHQSKYPKKTVINS